MKKCPSELNFEAFFHGERGEDDADAAADQKPGGGPHPPPFAMFSAADLSSFGFADSVTVSDYFVDHACA
jgi:hypothetical protein